MPNQNQTRSRLWTAEENETLRQGLFNHLSPAQIQALLPERSLKSIQTKLSHLRKEMAQSPAPSTPPAPEPASPLLPASSVEVTVPFSASEETALPGEVEKNPNEAPAPTPSEPEADVEAPAVTTKPAKKAKAARKPSSRKTKAKTALSEEQTPDTASVTDLEAADQQQTETVSKKTEEGSETPAPTKKRQTRAKTGEKKPKAVKAKSTEAKPKATAKKGKATTRKKNTESAQQPQHEQPSVLDSVLALHQELSLTPELLVDESEKQAEPAEKVEETLPSQMQALPEAVEESKPIIAQPESEQNSQESQSPIPGETAETPKPAKPARKVKRVSKAKKKQVEEEENSPVETAESLQSNPEAEQVLPPAAEGQEETVASEEAVPEAEQEKPAKQEEEQGPVIRFSAKAEVFNKGYGFVRIEEGDIYLPKKVIDAYQIRTNDLVSGTTRYSESRNSYVLAELDSVEHFGENTTVKATASGSVVSGYLSVYEEGYGFLRRNTYISGPDDIFVSEKIIHSLNLRSGDFLEGDLRVLSKHERSLKRQIAHVSSVNGQPVRMAQERKDFLKLTPVHPFVKMKMEKAANDMTGRIIDIIAPIGKGQRAMIKAKPKAGKTTVLTSLAHSIEKNTPDSHLIILLIDERPEEVTDFVDQFKGPRTEIISSTFDKAPKDHVRAASFALERAIALVEMGEDVVILMDSLTRLTRACNLIEDDNGARLSGGLSPAALLFPKKFFGSSRALREGGSLTVIATALVETGSRMDDVIFEEFKGTGNCEIALDRSLAQAKEFPAINLLESSTRRDEKLLTLDDLAAQSFILERIPDAPLPAIRAVKRLMQETSSNEVLGRSARHYFEEKRKAAEKH